MSVSGFSGTVTAGESALALSVLSMTGWPGYRAAFRSRLSQVGRTKRSAVPAMRICHLVPLTPIPELRRSATWSGLRSLGKPAPCHPDFRSGGLTTVNCGTRKHRFSALSHKTAGFCCSNCCGRWPQLNRSLQHVRQGPSLPQLGFRKPASPQKPVETVRLLGPIRVSA